MDSVGQEGSVLSREGRIRVSISVLSSIRLVSEGDTEPSHNPSGT